MKKGMRHILSTLLGCAGLLVILWTAGYVYYGIAQWGAPQQIMSADSPADLKAGAISSLSSLNTSIYLNPNFSDAWQSRGKLVELSQQVLPQEWQDQSWEKDLFKALVLSPVDTAPLLRLARSCAAGITQVVSGSTGQGCNGLFEALIVRDPVNGYSHYRYAEYLYTQALGDPEHRQEIASEVCRNYGEALGKMAATRYLRDWHEKTAISKCTNISNNFKSMIGLAPSSKNQWSLLGEGLGLKGKTFLNSNQAAVIKYLRDEDSPLSDYDGLAQGLGKSKALEAGKDILSSYVSQHKRDGKGWEALVRYLDKEKNVFGPELLEATLNEAVDKAEPELPSSLYLLAKSCQLKREDLVELNYNKLIAWDASDPAVYASYANCLLSLKHAREAISFFQKAVGLSPDAPELHVDLGRAYAADRQFDLAMNEFQKALGLNPKDQRARREMRLMGVYE